MKRLHRPDLYAWSCFDESRDVDFNSVAWVRTGGNVLIDPLPMSAHDREHLERLGGASTIVVTNSDHTRSAAELASHFGAELCGPRAEREGFALSCGRWLADGDEAAPGLRVIELQGSKTPGELALVLEGTTLITGDLVRGHAAGSLNLLPAAKLASRDDAMASVRRIIQEYRVIDAVLVGDGWPVFRDGALALAAMLQLEAFKAEAAAEGFLEVLERAWPPGTVLDRHTHPFDVKALVVRGELWLTIGSDTRRLTAGDTFALERGVPHAERYADAGAAYWVARRQ
ncbi:MAG TPA: cupin domain-containing protein [Burkholderiaceae bacterium]|nr:cupin domain-containing protein [Burkholderiaceae bacterium]